MQIIGKSTNFKAVLNEIARVGDTDCTVLLEGETGTGKEIAATAIHDVSNRRTGPFVGVNCSAIPAALLESELFGHERGAFTGAVGQKNGKFQAADRGTLFLDEIGDLPIELQPKLLRVLQERQVERLGGIGGVRIDTRIIAATNQNLQTMVQERKFRADLYFRLNVYPIRIPALRERAEDIPELVEHFVRQFSIRHRRAIDRVPRNIVEAMCAYPWPGNVRELQHFIERSVILTTGSILEAPVWELKNSDEYSESRVRTLSDAAKGHIIEALNETNWVIGGPNGAARRLGVPRTTLIAKMQRLGITRVVSDL